jgi:hypothetical protein
MANIKLGAYRAATTVLSTELNSLANNNVSALSAAYDNSTNQDLYADFELIVTFGVAPTAGASCSLYVAYAPDGTNYEVMPGAGSTLPNAAKLVTTFVLETTATAQRITGSARFTLPPGSMKFQLVDAAGQAFPASGTIVKLWAFQLQVV